MTSAITKSIPLSSLSKESVVNRSSVGAATTALFFTAIAGVVIYAHLYPHFWPALNTHLSSDQLWAVMGTSLGISFVATVATAVVIYRKIHQIPKFNKKIDFVNSASPLQIIQEFNDVDTIQLDFAWQHHAFMDALLKVTEEVREGDDEEIKKSWKAFLEKKDNTTVFYPDHSLVCINTEFALDRLEGNMPKIYYEVKTAESFFTDKEILDICAVQKDSFEVPLLAGNEAYDLDNHEKRIRLEVDNGMSFILAKDSNDRVVGMLQYSISPESNSTTITCLCRLSTHGLLNVGTKLIEKFKENTQSSYQTAYLHVRKSNPARILYEKMGFTVFQEKTNYYPCPKENAYVMRCPLNTKS